MFLRENSILYFCDNVVDGCTSLCRKEATTLASGCVDTMIAAARCVLPSTAQQTAQVDSAQPQLQTASDLLEQTQRLRHRLACESRYGAQTSALCVPSEQHFLAAAWLRDHAG